MTIENQYATDITFMCPSIFPMDNKKGRDTDQSEAEIQLQIKYTPLIINERKDDDNKC